MLSLSTFYATVMWTLRFWAFGWGYTIVRFRHIGLDIGTGRRAIDVPALWGGKVVRVVKTSAMGVIVILDTGLPGARRFHAYCHLSSDRLPRVGQEIRQGGRVGRLAAGPKGIAFTDVDFPGTLWDGIHLHLVLSSHISGAYLKGTGSTYANPESLILEVLADQAKPSPATGGPVLNVPHVPKLALRQLRIRNARSTTARTIKRIPKGAVVKASNVIGRYVYVSYDGVRGWAVSKYLIQRDRTTTAALRLRSSRTTSSSKNIILVIPKGTELTILGSAGDWRKVRYDGRTGWVHKGYLK